MLVKIQARAGNAEPNPKENGSSNKPMASQEAASSSQDRATAKLQYTVAQRMKEAGALGCSPLGVHPWVFTLGFVISTISNSCAMVLWCVV